MKYIANFSGGKDSTAMLLLIIEKNLPLDEIVFADTGVEFPELYTHIEKVKAYIGRDITILKPPHSFEYYLSVYNKKRKSSSQGRFGWPSMHSRWCTGFLKRVVIKKYFKGKEIINYVGYAYDEQQRLSKNIGLVNKIFPLVDARMTEAQALQYCYDRGFDWGGLYEKFSRVSCYLCPLQKLSELKTLHDDFPHLWAEMQRLDGMAYNKFRDDYTIEELDNKFKQAGKMEVLIGKRISSSPDGNALHQNLQR